MPSKPTPPDKIITPPEISKIEVGGELPERAPFGVWGSKWEDAFNKARQEDPRWIHWKETIPCDDHVRFSEACDVCVKKSKENAKLVAASAKVAAERVEDIVVSCRQMEVWMRVRREGEVGNEDLEA